MPADNFFISVASGTTLGVAGSHTVNLTLLCGLSGTNIIPVQVNAAGRVITTSGA